MTEFEMAYLLTDMQSAMANVATTQITLVSGFLVASYAIAHRLNRMMLSIALPIYTLWYFGNSFLLSRMQISLNGLVHQIHEVAAAGKGLQWHSAANAMAPEWLLEIGPYVQWTLIFLIYGGTILFFVQCRRHNRNAETGAWKPKS